MKRACPFFATMAALLMFAGLLTAAEPTALFNGKDLTGWKLPNPNPFWSAKDGVLVGESDAKRAGSMLYTEAAFTNFVLDFEARWDGDIDSGVMFRRLPPGQKGAELQLQIGVSVSLKVDMTCSFYTGKYPEAGRAAELAKYLKPGDWNRIRLEAKGDTFTVWLNGKQVTRYTDPKYITPEPIGLQIHPGVKMKIEFRNITVQALD